MRPIIEAVVAIALTAHQVIIPAVQIPFTETVEAANANTVVQPASNLTFEPQALSVLGPQEKKSIFYSDVVVPLRSAQAAKAAIDAENAAKAAAQAQAKAAAAKKATSTPAGPKLVIGGDDAWAQLRYCEAGGDYRKNTGNGYFGAYQYDLRTWGNYAGFARPDLAPPEVQDAKARDTQARRGWSPWPSCARRLGLL